MPARRVVGHRLIESPRALFGVLVLRRARRQRHILRRNDESPSFEPAVIGLDERALPRGFRRRVRSRHDRRGWRPVTLTLRPVARRRVLRRRLRFEMGPRPGLDPRRTDHAQSDNDDERRCGCHPLQGKPASGSSEGSAGLCWRSLVKVLSRRARSARLRGPAPCGSSPHRQRSGLRSSSAPARASSRRRIVQPLPIRCRKVSCASPV